MPERIVTLATFPLPHHEGCYWQVSVSSAGPVIPETTSQADATAAFTRIVAELSTHGRKVTRKFWNGYLAEETTL